MLTRHLTNKILDIRLEEEKFYFPGETIKGFVIIHSKNTIKVNSIQLKFSGQVYIHLKEKEITTLFQEPLVLSVYPNSASPKQTTLNTSEHAFPFQFIVPKNLNLPSSMEFGKKGYIRYTINALLDRPMLPESLCPKVDYIVSLLEYIDIEKSQFKIPQEKSQDIMLPQAKYNQKCMVRAYIPRLGFTRGDIIPLKVKIEHFKSYSLKDGIIVDFVRTVEIRATKHTIFKEAILKSTTYLIDIKSPIYNQSIICQLLIPTSTPPSIRYKDKVIRFHYKVRISVLFDEKKTNCIILDMPIVVGTWPRASVPIEDDDGDDNNNGLFSSDITDEDDDIDIESLRTCSIDDKRSSSSYILPSWHSTNSSTSTLTSTAAAINNNVERSDSVASKASNRSFNSISSWKSNRSWEQYQQNHLSRNTSQSTTYSSPDRLPSYGGYNNNSHRSCSVYSNDSLYPINNNMNRNSGTTSGNSSSIITRHQQSMVNLPPTMQYDSSNNNIVNLSPTMQYNSSNDMVNLPPTMQYNSNNNMVNLQYNSSNNIINLLPTIQYNNNVRYNRFEDNLLPPTILLENDVPTHILEPLPQTTASFIPLASPIHEETPIVVSRTESSQDLDDSSCQDSDEDDLLAIIERKKKNERRELKKKTI